MGLVNAPWWRKLAPVAVALLACGAALVLATWNPSAHHFPRCVFRRLTGWTCPGCGSQRAIHHLLRGDLLTALRFNAFVVFSIPLLVVGYVQWTLAMYRGRWQITWRAPALWIWILAIALVLFSIARNIPWFPFNLLAV